MTKNLFITAILILVYTAGFSQQESDYVEVTVTDTIKLVPDEIIFNLVIRAGTDNRGNDGKTAGTHNKTTGNAADKIKKIIQEQKIDTLSSGQYSIMKDEFYTGVEQKKILLRFFNFEQLAAFIKEANAIDNIYGFIISKKSNQADNYKQALTKKLLQKAFNEAAFIAAQSKKTIVKLIQVKDEDIEKATGGWTSYPPLSALAGIVYTDDSRQIIIERKLRIRYSWQ